MSDKPLATAEPTTLSDDYQGRRFVKSIRWWDGFNLALSVPGFLFPSLGLTVLYLGALVAFILLRRDQPAAARPIRLGSD